MGSKTKAVCDWLHQLDNGAAEPNNVIVVKLSKAYCFCRVFECIELLHFSAVHTFNNKKQLMSSIFIGLHHNTFQDINIVDKEKSAV